MTEAVIAGPLRERDFADWPWLPPDRVAVSRRAFHIRFVDHVLGEHLAQRSAHLRGESGADFAGVDELSAFIDREVQRADLAVGRAAGLISDDDEFLLIE